MDMEQFKMVMDLLQGVSDGAYAVAIFYMVYLLLVEFMLPILITGGLAYATYHVFRMMIAAAHRDDLLASLRDSMGVGTPGVITKREIALMHDWVAQHKKKEE